MAIARIHVVARGGYPSQLALVLADGPQARDDLVPLGDLILDHVMAGRGIPEHPERLLQAVATGETRERWWVVVGVVVRHELVHGIFVPAVDLGVEATNQRLVLVCRRHDGLLCRSFE